jgi:hypothetical protein
VLLVAAGAVPGTCLSTSHLSHRWVGAVLELLQNWTTELQLKLELQLKVKLVCSVGYAA